MFIAIISTIISKSASKKAKKKENQKNSPLFLKAVLNLFSFLLRVVFEDIFLFLRGT